MLIVVSGSQPHQHTSIGKLVGEKTGWYSKWQGPFELQPVALPGDWSVFWSGYLGAVESEGMVGLEGMVELEEMEGLEDILQRDGRYPPQEDGTVISCSVLVQFAGRW